MSPDPQRPSLSAALARLDDTDVLALVAGAEPLSVGIGGSTSRTRVLGTEVFVKRLPLTRIEEQAPRSTANVFDLPPACHYGIGSPGFGAGREIAAHELTTGWVASGATDAFPLLHHWRVLDQPCHADVSEVDGEEARRRWGTAWPRVRRRVELLASARRSVVLFLEHVPDTLGSWLRGELARGAGAAAISSAARQLVALADWTGAHGLLHLDVHPGNVLVRDGRLLLTDFGLSMHRDFLLDPHEREFFSAHGGYDRDSGLASLLHWVLAEAGVGPRARRLAVLEAAAQDPRADELRPLRDRWGDRWGDGARVVAEHAAVGAAMTTLIDRLSADASATTYAATVRPGPVTRTR
ncbi:phosphotransferase [Isoptericola sp. NPDC057559]|uniref:phosphotransferase n=1 Tax=Isoptericola sp. NPDC057559 TaxID=3346168 RepID=UPI00367482DF